MPGRARGEGRAGMAFRPGEVVTIPFKESFMPELPIALQLYTVRGDCAADFPKALKQVAEIGYKYVELAGFNGLSAPQVKEELDRNGLRVTSAHVGLDSIADDQTIADYKTIGAEILVVPWLGPEHRQGAAGYRKTARALNDAGAVLHSQGMTLAYHNHNFEFEDKVEGGLTGMEIFIAETDPVLVKIELDTYWALFAGMDPVAVLKKYPGRFLLLHIKDMNPADRSFAEVGTGTLPLDAILAAAPAAGAKYLIVEQDDCKRPPMESIAISLANLKAKGYA